MSGDPFGEIDSLLDDLDEQNKMLSEFDDIDNILRDNNLLDGDLTLVAEDDDSPAAQPPPVSNTKPSFTSPSTTSSTSTTTAIDDDLPSATLMRGVTFVAPGMPRLAPVPIADKATSVVVNQRRNKRSLAMSTADHATTFLPMPQKLEIVSLAPAAPAQRAQLATVEVLSQPKKATALKVQPSLPPKSEDARASMVRTASSNNAATATNANAAAGGDDDDSSTDSTGDDNPEICTLLYSNEAGKQDQVRAATFNRQVDKMLEATSAAKGINEFLRTYRAFSSTDQLFHLLRARFIATNDDADGKVRRVRVLAIVNLLLTKHWDHFSHNTELVDELRTFLDTIEQLGMAGPAQQLRRRLEKQIGESAASSSSGGALPRASSANNGTTRSTFSEPPPLPRVNDMSVLDQTVDDAGDEVFVLHVLKWHPEEIARQLTLLEYELYRRVQLPELMNQNWTRAAAHELSPNLTTLIAHFNRISQWVQTTILRHIDAKLRARLVTHFVEVAKYLAALQNYDGVMQFMAAFQSASVSRLKKTWAAQSKATQAELTRLKDLLSPQSSFAKLRDALRSANPPAVPYVGMYLADLTFIDEGNDHTVAHEKPLPPGRRRSKAKTSERARDKLRDGLCRKYTLLNTQKFRMIASVLNNFEQYQLAPYNLRPIPVLQHMLRNLRYIEDERRMYALSLAIETRTDSSADAAALEQWEREDDSGTALVTSGDSGDDDSKPSSLMLVKQLSRTGLARSKSAFDKLKVGADRGSSHTSAAAAAAAAAATAGGSISTPSSSGVDDDDDDAYDSGDEAMAPAGDAWAAEGEQVLKTGFMRKKGGLRHNWTERWFVLTTSALTYFASRSDTQAKGRIMLRDATLGQVKDKGAISVDMLLGVHFQGRTYVLECKDKASKAKWVEALSSAIDNAKTKTRK
jgi:hypothetical protein